MDWSAVSPLLPFGTSGFAIALMFVAVRMTVSSRRLAGEADARYRAEVKDHVHTEQELEHERSRRRATEDQLDELAREVRALKQEVAVLEKWLTGLKRDDPE